MAVLDKEVTLTPAVGCAVVSAVCWTVSRSDTTVLISGLMTALTLIFAGASFSLWCNWAVEENGKARMQRKIEQTYDVETARIEAFGHMAEFIALLKGDALDAFWQIVRNAGEEDLLYNEGERKGLMVNGQYIPPKFLQEMINGTDSETRKVPTQGSFTSPTDRTYHATLIGKMVELGVATEHKGNTGNTVLSWKAAIAAVKAAEEAKRASLV